MNNITSVFSSFPQNFIPDDLNGAIVVSVINGELNEAKIFPDVNSDFVNFIDLHELAIWRGKKAGRPPHPMKPEAMALARKFMAMNPDTSMYRLVRIIAGKLSEKSLYAPSTKTIENWIKEDRFN